MHSTGCAVKMKQYVLFPFRTCISECIAIVICDNLSMFDAYDGILMSFCAFKLSVLKTVNKVCLAINCLTPTGACSVEQQHVTTLLYRLGAEAGWTTGHDQAGPPGTQDWRPDAELQFRQHRSPVGQCWECQNLEQVNCCAKFLKEQIAYTYFNHILQVLDWNFKKKVIEFTFMLICILVFMQWRLFIQNKMIHLMNVLYLLSDYRASSQCIRTMTCDYALCSLFAPGDRHVIIGTKVRNCYSVWCYRLWMFLKVKFAVLFVHNSSTACTNFHLPMTGWELFPDK